ncbi:phage baseplate assembly protein V [Tateyamaria sp.]|uniref:phage baseplate assembly protein V n=1 Tax=Tateyamaria sp. TaxID=1929288 RepID=UPI003B224BB9
MNPREGLVTALVIDVDDTDNLGRIKVELPGAPGRSNTAWAPVAAPMAGNDRGFFFAPELEDEVVVGFLSGDPEQPVILGYTWNGQDAPPTSHPRERITRSKNGHTIRMIDATPGAEGAGSIVIEDANGNKIVMSNGKILMQAQAIIELDAPIVKITGPGRDRQFNYGTAVI